VKIHLDTDVGGDIDDLQALAYLLASPDVELTGITTAAEDGGRRAGYVRRALELANRLDVPVAAGIDVACGRFRQVPTYPAEVDYWGQAVPPLPGPAEAALRLLLRSLATGATVVGIGPFTNIAALEELQPGRLADASIVLMGTTVVAPAADLPQLELEMDYNVQQDASAAATVLSCSSPLLVPVGVSMRAAIRRSHLPRLASGGPLAALIARQAEVFDAEWHNAERHRKPSGVPADMINFLYDPVACAIATGWRTGVAVQTLSVVSDMREGCLIQRVATGGKRLPVVVGLDGVALEEEWVRRISGPAEA
jgi:inosine-uridine nucleoside N-ribohydrolase